MAIRSSSWILRLRPMRPSMTNSISKHAARSRRRVPEYRCLKCESLDGPYVVARERTCANWRCRLPHDRALKAAMNDNFQNLAARAAPAIFVVLWSTGFIATKYVLRDAEPLTYLAIRMAVVVGLMAIIVAIARPRWPDASGMAHSAVAGILVHGIYFGGTAIAISHSIPAGLSALIPGLQPILTSTLANRWLGERVTPLQWGGLLLGLGGVVLLLHGRPMSGEAGWGWLGPGGAAGRDYPGALFSARLCGQIDRGTGNLVQYLAVTVLFAAAAGLFENNQVHWTG